MEALGGWRLDEDYKKVWDEDFRTWEGEDGLFVRCVWFPGLDKRLKEVFVGRMQANHGPEGMAKVLEAWEELCPDMVPRFRRVFDDMQARRVGGAPLRWVGRSPYACGVAPNNKAFVEYIGPQAEIPKRRMASIAAANVRISWYRYILASQKTLEAKLSAPANPTQMRDAVCATMSDLEQHLKYAMSGFGWRSGHSVAYTAKQSPFDQPCPLCIPDDLPEAARISLHRTAGEIVAVARLTRFLVGRGDKPAFKPYDHMVMAFSEYSGVEASAWGDYAKVEGLNETWKQLPPQQRKAVEEISFHGLSCLRAVLRENLPQ